MQDAAQHQAVHGIEVNTGSGWIENRAIDSTYHNSFAFILNDMARPANLVTSAKTEEHKFIGRIYRFLSSRRGHRGSLPLGGHGLTGPRSRAQRKRKYQGEDEIYSHLPRAFDSFFLPD